MNALKKTKILVNNLPRLGRLLVLYFKMIPTIIFQLYSIPTLQQLKHLQHRIQPLNQPNPTQSTLFQKNSPNPLNINK